MNLPFTRRKFFTPKDLVAVMNWRVLDIFQECLTTVNKMGIKIPKKIKLMQGESLVWVGLACLKENYLVLSTYAIEELNNPFIHGQGANHVKAIILHELAHFVAEGIYPDCGHGPTWIEIAKTIGENTGIDLLNNPVATKNGDFHALAIAREKARKEGKLWML